MPIEERRKREGAEKVGGELALEAVDGELALAGEGHDAGVVD